MCLTVKLAIGDRRLLKFAVAAFQVKLLDGLCPPTEVGVKFLVIRFRERCPRIDFETIVPCGVSAGGNKRVVASCGFHRISPSALLQYPYLTIGYAVVNR